MNNKSNLQTRTHSRVVEEVLRFPLSSLEKKFREQPDRDSHLARNGFGEIGIVATRPIGECKNIYEDECEATMDLGHDDELVSVFLRRNVRLG